MSDSLKSDFWKFDYLKYIMSDDLFIISSFIANKIHDNIKQTNTKLSIFEISQIVAYMFWNKKMHNLVVANICKKLTATKQNESNENVLLNVFQPNPHPDYNN
jgi:hypothetical protein